MTKEELKKKIEEAAKEYSNQFKDILDLTLPTADFKAGAEFGIRLEREAAQELVEALDLCAQQFRHSRMHEGYYAYDFACKALTRWRERTKIE